MSFLKMALVMALGLFAFSTATVVADVSIEGVMKITQHKRKPLVSTVVGDIPFTVVIRANGDYRIDGSMPVSGASSGIPYSLVGQSNLVYFLRSGAPGGAINVGPGWVAPEPPSLHVVAGNLPLFMSNPLAGGPCLWLAYGFGEAGWREVPTDAHLPNIFLTSRSPKTLGWRWDFSGLQDGMTCPASVSLVRDSSLDKPIAEELGSQWLAPPTTTNDYNGFVSNRNDRLAIPDGYKGVELKVAEYRTISGLKVPSRFHVSFFSQLISDGPMIEYEIMIGRIAEIAPQERLLPALPRKLWFHDYRGLGRDLSGSDERIHYMLEGARDVPDLESSIIRYKTWKWFGYSAWPPSGPPGWIRSLPIVVMVILGGGVVFLGLLPVLRRFGPRSRTRGGADGADNGSAP
jgi:hypothetical protein